MELTLNLVWVGVAVAAILAQVVTLCGSGASLGRPASYVRKLIAMGCALVILFFVISMTDDLHNQQVLVEDRRSSRNAAVMATTANPAPLRTVPTQLLLFFPPPTVSATAPGLRKGVEGIEFLPVAEVAHENLSSRAPPRSRS